MPRTFPGATVVKLGGSLLGSDGLAAACNAIDGPVAVVPGGGPFADAVRAAQAQVGFGDGAAHCMALLAMAQMAFAIADLRPGFRVATTASEALRTIGDGKVPVWAPLDLVHDRTRVEESWRMTSDSLAVHHASELSAARLVLVKSRPHDAALDEARACRDADVVDPLFPDMLERTTIAAYWIGDGDAARLARFLGGEEGAAIRLTSNGS